MHLREISQKDGITFNTTARFRKGRTPLQLPMQLLRRVALSSKALAESSLVVGL